MKLFNKRIALNLEKVLRRFFRASNAKSKYFTKMNFILLLSHNSVHIDVHFQWKKEHEYNFINYEQLSTQLYELTLSVKEKSYFQYGGCLGKWRKYWFVSQLMIKINGGIFHETLKYSLKVVKNFRSSSWTIRH